MPDTPARKADPPRESTDQHAEIGPRVLACDPAGVAARVPHGSVGLRAAFAVEELVREGVLSGVRSRRISTRVDPGLIEAAKRRTGLEKDSDVINAALAVIADGDDFAAWLVS